MTPFLHKRLSPSHSRPRLLCLLFLLTWITTSLATQSLSIDEQRQRFIEARNAIEQGERQRAQELAGQLGDYLLYPYLEYWQLSAKLDTRTSVEIQAFLQRYSDLPLASALHGHWLRTLAKKGRWADFLANDNHNRSTEMRCYRHQAQLHTGNAKAAWEGARRLWLVGYSQNKACDPLFAAWEKAGQLTDDLRWQRIELAMDNGKSSLARYLARELDEKQRSKVHLWRRVYHDPQLISRSDQLKNDTPFNRRVIVQGLERLAARQHAQAAKLWSGIADKYHFSQKQRQQVIRAIGLNYAFDGDIEALQWLGNIDPAERDHTLRSWAVRTALRAGQWQDALDWIKVMPASERNSTAWRYWEARALEALGHKAQADKLYRKVGGKRSYYGFLAADRLEGEYNLTHESLQVSATELAKLRDHPGLLRALELYRLDLYNEARREWAHAIARMNREQRLAAGMLAAQENWYDRAFLTLAKANHFDDLEIRFPLVHTKQFAHEAQSQQIDPAWVFAVARQESALVPDARSHVGALGLMQLMPNTGLSIARQLKIPLENKADLLVPATNIRFGAYYLRQVLDRFNDNAVMATAAYNAGPQVVETWYPQQQKMDADIWVDTIPYHETRQYLRRVFSYTVFYDQRLNDRHERLIKRMPSIENRNCELCRKDHEG